MTLEQQQQQQQLQTTTSLKYLKAIRNTRRRQQRQTELIYPLLTMVPIYNLLIFTPRLTNNKSRAAISMEQHLENNARPSFVASSTSKTLPFTITLK